jgi:Flp pilus assembly pilin Flp
VWENQLAVTGHFPPTKKKVVRMSKLGFPSSNPSLAIIPLKHGLESHVTNRRGITHGHLLNTIQSECAIKELIGLSCQRDGKVLHIAEAQSSRVGPCGGSIVCRYCEPGTERRGQLDAEIPGGHLRRTTVKIAKLLVSIVRDERGGEVLEYALIAGLIVIAAIAAITSVGTKVLGRWTSVQNSM